MSAVRVGIAGIGAITREYLGLYADNRLNCRVTALQGRDIAKLSQTVHDFSLGDVSLFTNYETMLESGKIDAVIICTPHGMHPIMAMQAVRHGVHALIEKPLGAARSDALLLLDMVEKSFQICTGVLYCRRMSPVYQQVKNLVDDGAIGSLKRASWIVTNLYRTPAYHDSAPWRGNWAGESGGLLMTQASHQLDLLLWFCGMPENLRSFCSTKQRAIDVENDAVIQMEFASGATAQFIASSHEYPGSNRLELSGDCGQIIVLDDNKIICRRLSQSEHSYAQSTSNTSGPIAFTETVETFDGIDNHSQQAAIINDFMEAIKQKRLPICSIYDALKSLSVINAAYLSSWKNETISLDFDDVEYLKELQRHL